MASVNVLLTIRSHGKDRIDELERELVDLRDRMGKVAHELALTRTVHLIAELNGNGAAPETAQEDAPQR